ncbi:hypothetical protein N3K66_001833 [Trichothecium roseum]|uniref:Uncharacterized protein n=1 Tax=Trichothecium roseum TaxID=47278 RepID=A0ACC0V9B3_9HYPO|nr:hypothetical protein N3K66_001833 [Trichothecium roseum]
MFEGFEEFAIKTQDDPEVIIRGVKSGDPSSSSLPPLLLLHGFPQTHHIWHEVAPQLTSRYSVVAMDLRGYGASSKPAGVASYAKSAMARDCIAVMDGLGFTAGGEEEDGNDGNDEDDKRRGAKFFVCAHDRGARVAHKLCVDHPGRVRSAVLLDICPTLAMYEKTDFRFARAYFHWFWLIQPSPLPELAIGAAPRRFAELFMGARQVEGLGVFKPEAFERYVAGMEDAGCVRAMCDDYRAAATVDLDEARADLEAGRRVRCPVRVLWGRRGVIEECFDAVAEWRAVADEGASVTGRSVESGHYIPEQVPDEVVKAVEEFLV